MAILVLFEFRGDAVQYKKLQDAINADAGIRTCWEEDDDGNCVVLPRNSCIYFNATDEVSVSDAFRQLYLSVGFEVGREIVTELFVSLAGSKLLYSADGCDDELCHS